MVQFDLRKLFRVPTSAQRLAALNLRPDLAEVASRMPTDERTDPDLQQLSSCLRESESVIAVVEGRATRQLGLLALTTERVIFRAHGARSGVPASILLGDITTVDDEVKSMTGRVIFRSDDSIVEVDKILGAGAAQFADATRHQLVDPGPLAARDPIQDLLDLRARRAAGTISESDYQAARSRLLDEL
jgi:hypothetical protein